MTVHGDGKAPVLSAGDWRCILDFVYRLGCHRDVAELKASILDDLALLVDSTWSIFVRSSARGNALDIYESVARGKDNPFAVMPQHLVVSSPISPYLSPHTTVIFDSVDSPSFGDELYRDYLVPYGIAFMASIVLVEDRKAMGELDLFRSREGGDFSPRDREVLQTVAPFISQRLADLLNRDVIQRGHDDGNRFSKRYDLSERETEVLDLIIEGLTSTQIADRLCVSLSTVKKHSHSIYAKTGTGGRSALYRLYSGM